MTKTPKEKAKELVDKFYAEIETRTSKRLLISYQKAKGCAWLCVEEIINESNYVAHPESVEADYKKEILINRQRYWQEVKTEILKLR